MSPKFQRRQETRSVPFHSFESTKNQSKPNHKKKTSKTQKKWILKKKPLSISPPPPSRPSMPIRKKKKNTRKTTIIMVTNPLPSHPSQPTAFLSFPSATIPTTTSLCNSTNQLIDLTVSSPTSTDFSVNLSSTSRPYTLFFWIPETVSIHTFRELCTLSNLDCEIKETSPSLISTNQNTLKFRGIIHLDSRHNVLNAYKKLSYQCFNMEEFFQVELSLPRKISESLSKLIFYYPPEIQPLAPAHFHQICAYHLPPNSFPILGVYKSANQKELSLFFPKNSLPTNLTSSNFVDLPSYIVTFNSSDDAILVHSRLSTMLKAKKISLTHLELFIGSKTYFSSMDMPLEKVLNDLSKLNETTATSSKHPNGHSMSSTTLDLPTTSSVPFSETLSKQRNLDAELNPVSTSTPPSSLNLPTSHPTPATPPPARKCLLIVIDDSPPPSPTLKPMLISPSRPSSPSSSPKKSPLLTTDSISSSSSASNLFSSTDAASLVPSTTVVPTPLFSSSSSSSVASSPSPELLPLHPSPKVSTPSPPRISISSTSSPGLASSPTLSSATLPPVSYLSLTSSPPSSSTLLAVSSTPPPMSPSPSPSFLMPSATSMPSHLTSPCCIIKKKRRIQPTFVGPLQSNSSPLASKLPPSSSSLHSAAFGDPLFLLPTPLPHPTPPAPSSFPMDLFESIRPTFLTTLLNFCSSNSSTSTPSSSSSTLLSSTPPTTITTTPPPIFATSWMDTAHAIYEFIYQHHVSLPIHQVVFGTTTSSENVIHVWVTSDRYLLLYHLHLAPLVSSTTTDATSASETYRYMLAVAKDHRLGNYQRFQYSGFYLSMTFPIQWVMYEPKVNYPLLVYEKKMKSTHAHDDMQPDVGVEFSSTPSSILVNQTEESILSLRNDQGEPILNLVHPNAQFHYSLIKCLRKHNYIVGWCADHRFCVWEIPEADKDIPRTLAPKKDFSFPCSSNVTILDVALDVSNDEIRLFILTTKELCEWKLEGDVKIIHTFELPETILLSDCKLAVSPHASHLVVCLASKLIVFNSSTSPPTYLIEWTLSISPSIPCNTKLMFDPYRPTIFLSLIQGQLKMWDIQSNTGLLFVHRLQGTLDMDVVSSDLFPSTIVTLQSGSNALYSKSQPLSLCTFRAFPWLYTAIDTPLS